MKITEANIEAAAAAIATARLNRFRIQVTGDTLDILNPKQTAELMEEARAALEAVKEFTDEPPQDETLAQRKLSKAITLIDTAITRAYLDTPTTVAGILRDIRDQICAITK